MLGPPSATAASAGSRTNSAFKDPAASRPHSPTDTRHLPQRLTAAFWILNLQDICWTGGGPGGTDMEGSLVSAYPQCGVESAMDGDRRGRRLRGQPWSRPSQLVDSQCGSGMFLTGSWGREDLFPVVLSLKGAESPLGGPSRDLSSHGTSLPHPVSGWENKDCLT